MRKRNVLRIIFKDLWAGKDTHISLMPNWRGVLVEAERRFMGSLMEHGNFILVAEAVTRVAQVEYGMMNGVMEVVEDLLQLIQMPYSITNSKISENVKSNS